MTAFPKTPLEEGYQGRVPVNLIDGNGHGSHWGAVVKEVESVLPRLPEMLQNARSWNKGKYIPEYERGCGNFSSGAEYCYSLPDESCAPIETMILICCSEETKSNELCAAYPIVKKSHGISLKRRITAVNVS